MTESIVIKRNSKTRDLVETALLIALVFVATRFINIRLPVAIHGGLIHTGNAMLFLSAIGFGKKKGALAGGFGMAIYDILSGWLAWAPFTFVIRFSMGYLIGYMTHLDKRNGDSLPLNLIAISLSGILMIIGYYFTEVILYSNWMTPFGSVVGNSLQLVIGAVIGLPLVVAIKKTKIF